MSIIMLAIGIVSGICYCIFKDDTYLIIANIYFVGTMLDK